MYPVVTMLIGLIFLAFGALNFVRALRVHDSLIAQLTPVRIMLSGCLFLLHYPITSRAAQRIQDFLGERNVEISDTVSIWAAILVLIGVQCVVLPSWRFLALSSAIDSLRSRG